MNGNGTGWQFKCPWEPRLGSALDVPRPRLEITIPFSVGTALMPMLVRIRILTKRVEWGRDGAVVEATRKAGAAQAPGAADWQRVGEPPRSGGTGPKKIPGSRFQPPGSVYFMK